MWPCAWPGRRAAMTSADRPLPGGKPCSAPATRCRRCPPPPSPPSPTPPTPLPPPPPPPTGPFPQPADIRAARAAFKRGDLDIGSYRAKMRAAIALAVRKQEELGIDVLVHGE